MSETLALIVVIVLMFAALVGVLVYIARAVLEFAGTAMQQGRDIAEAGTDAARSSATAMQGITADMLAIIDVTNESHRQLAVDLITTALTGSANGEPASQTRGQPRVDGTEPPDAIIVDTDLEDPSDAWMPDQTINQYTAPAPMRELPVDDVARSGQAGVV